MNEVVDLVSNKHEGRPNLLLFPLERGDGDHRHDKRAEDLGDLLAEASLGEPADNDLFPVHDLKEVEGTGLADDGDDGWPEQLCRPY